jgi:hypothetical protein
MKTRFENRFITNPFSDELDGQWGVYDGDHLIALCGALNHARVITRALNQCADKIQAEEFEAHA